MHQGARIQTEINKNLPFDGQTSLTFLEKSKGWFEKFKKRWNPKSCKSHGESSDADNAAISAELPGLQQKLKNYDSRDIWNADEFGLVYRMAPDRTISQQPLRGRKKDKVRLTYLACANLDRSEKFH